MYAHKRRVLRALYHFSAVMCLVGPNTVARDKLQNTIYIYTYKFIAGCPRVAARNENAWPLATLTMRCVPRELDDVDTTVTPRRQNEPRNTQEPKQRSAQQMSTASRSADYVYTSATNVRVHNVPTCDRIETGAFSLTDRSKHNQMGIR